MNEVLKRAKLSWVINAFAKILLLSVLSACATKNGLFENERSVKAQAIFEKRCQGAGGNI